ncbi:glycosyltransferase family 2 protein [Spongiactinospora rosea]|uniref:Glycosyltransferase family 2 protein n=1 Tax=Spongiactinospora rosea TaxID=2248750 RepID=A0A366LLM0_9ACTN|nr:glycosyltransferase family 2 protein [Spongiactinospora rosea]RBQ14818.1 glycosyltransferase family 2 protein [Spongiactinospora rosea]
MTGEHHGVPGDRPRIRRNDHSPLTPPGLGAFTPSLPVSVVIPAHGGQSRLDHTLAALSAQTYPAHLLEVIVVDDGSDPPLRLPEIAPPGTRIVTADPSGWGIGHAVNTGAAVAEGTLIQRLDADMVVCREHIEALARWHHLTDYAVTIGYKRFLAEPEGLSPARVRDGVAGGGLGTLFDLAAAVPSSTEATIERLDGLRTSRNPYHCCTGPTLCLHRELFRAAGGIDAGVPRGEDTEFAYRLAQAGAVFVPDPLAQAVHLGLPAQRLERDLAVRVVAPYLAQRVPLRRDLRKDAGRRWRVPYVEVVLEVGDAPEETVRAAVGAALTGVVGDVVVTLVAPWSRPTCGRRAVLRDPDLDLRLMSEHFAGDDRVRLADAVQPSPAPIPFRYTGPVDAPLGRDTLRLMIETMQEHRPGLVLVDLPAGGTARLERTEALSRALLLANPGVPLGELATAGRLAADHKDELIEATHGVLKGEHADFWPAPKKKPAAPAAQPREPAPAPPVQPSRPRSGSLLGRLTGRGRPGG